MEKFEYLTHVYSTEGTWGGHVNVYKLQTELNQLGSSGWELVSSLSTNQKMGATISIVSIFKRKLMEQCSAS